MMLALLHLPAIKSRGGAKLSRRSTAVIEAPTVQPTELPSRIKNQTLRYIRHTASNYLLEQQQIAAYVQCPFFCAQSLRLSPKSRFVASVTPPALLVSFSCAKQADLVGQGAADIWSHNTACPLYPREQTCAVQRLMSALGQ
jgi:hypothetical protein